MKRSLAIGSSQLAGFAKGMRQVGAAYNDNFDYAALWETGFGYLDLEKDGRITAPDTVPTLNNPYKTNLKKVWFVKGTRNIPCVDHYEKIYIVASPSKYFAPLYYSNPSPSPLSRELIKVCLTSQHIRSSRFNHITQWQFRISPIIRKLCSYCPKKVVFIGAPLPAYGKESKFFEVLRSSLTKDENLREVHRQNIALLKLLCRESITDSSDLPVKIFLPPDHLLCDLCISTLEQYEHNTFHANELYWCEVVKGMIQSNLL
jgi:hypothetical protein